MGTIISASAVVALVCVAGYPQPSQAQTLDPQQAEYCANIEEQVSPDLQIRACTSLIHSGRLTAQDLPLSYDNRGNGYRASGDRNHAMADYNEAIRLNPQLATAYYNRGILYQDMDDHSRALADFNEAIRLDPQLAVAHSSICFELTYIRDLARARSACDASLRIRLTANTLANRGILGILQQRFQDAWNDFDASVRLDPGKAGPRYGRGIAALRLGRAAAGQADIAAATRQDATIALVYADMGIWPMPSMTASVQPVPNARSVNPPVSPDRLRQIVAAALRSQRNRVFSERIAVPLGLTADGMPFLTKQIGFTVGSAVHAFAVHVSGTGPLIFMYIENGDALIWVCDTNGALLLAGQMIGGVFSSLTVEHARAPFEAELREWSTAQLPGEANP